MIEERSGTEVIREAEIREAEPVHTGDLDKAIERIRARYGSDLQAFFRDAREAILKRQSSERNKSETCVL